MWLIPLLLIGALAFAAVSKSPRETALPSRQLPSPNVAGLPGPISVLGEILRIGQNPSPTVILCAIAEAESIGRSDLAADIVRAFVAPVVYAHRARGGSPSYERGSCELPRAPRAQADYQRGSCALPRSPRAEATAFSAAPPPPPPLAARQPTENEILAMLNADPQAFLSMVSARRPPVIDVPLEAPVVMPSALAAQTPSPPPLSADQLVRVPGAAGAGIFRDPATGAEVFEVSWLRGYPLPPLPETIEGRPVHVSIVDALATTQPAGLPPETVAQMQEAAGLPGAADQTRALAPGSPLGGVSDEAWREFVQRLEREAPTFSSTRHVGQYRLRRERLAELGIDPQVIQDSATAQRAALDADLADAHHHASEGGVFSEHLRRSLAVPGLDGPTTITLSGLLGVIQCAGLEGAVGWLERPNDRKRYPHTTQAFLRTNGIF